MNGGCGECPGVMGRYGQRNERWRCVQLCATCMEEEGGREEGERRERGGKEGDRES